MSASIRWIGEVGYDVDTWELQFRCSAVADERMLETLLADRAELRRCERKLNAIRAALDDTDCDDYGATEDRIRWILDSEAR